MGDHAAVERQLVAVLSGRVGHRRVRDFVRLFWAAHQLDADELIAQAKGVAMPYEPQFGRLANAVYTGEITCGHNPWIYARLVANLRTERVDDARRLMWERHVLPADVYERAESPVPEPETLFLDLPL